MLVSFIKWKVSVLTYNFKLNLHCFSAAEVLLIAHDSGLKRTS